MAKNITKATLIYDAKHVWYASKEIILDDELLVLAEFVDSVLRYKASRALEIKEQIKKGNIGWEPIEAEIIAGKIQLYHLHVSGLKKEPRLTKEELIEFIDKWFELVASKVERIVITNENGKFSIGTE